MYFLSLDNSSNPNSWTKDKSPNLKNHSNIIFEKENPIHFLVENNTEVLFNLKLVKHKFTCQSFTNHSLEFDSLCWDENDNCFVIIEYKLGKSKSLIDQGMSYLNTMLNRKHNVLYELNEQLGEKFKLNDVNWDKSRIIFVSQEFTKFQLNSVSFKNLPFELWEIKRYSNNTISMYQHVTNSKIKLNLGDFVDDIRKNDDDKGTNKVVEEIRDYDDTFLLKSSSENIKTVWKKIKEQITTDHFMGTRFNYTKNYNRFSLSNNSPICYFIFQNNKIRIDISGGTDYVTEKRKGKSYVEIDDPKKLTKRIEKEWYKNRTDGKKVLDVRFQIIISKEEEVDYLVSLLKQKYDKM